MITMLGAHVHPSGLIVWSGGLVALLAEFGFSTGAARVALMRLVNRDLLARRRVGRLVFYTLTPRSEKLLTEGDQRIFSLGRRQKSADRWTVLWHAIPEHRRLDRGRLARRLRFLGFGTLQDGTWVAPHDRADEVIAVIRDLDVEEHVGVMVGEPAASLGFRAFIGRIWPVGELSERYRLYVEDFRPYASARRSPKLADRDAFFIRICAVHVFRNFPADDPELPDELMTQPKFRAEAVDVFHGVYERLAEPADRYFREMTAAPADQPQLGELLRASAAA
jgi:phenylacetic acid degradation operon negative regulatory protein